MDENNSEPSQQTGKPNIDPPPAQETIEPPKPPTSTSWADQAEEEDSQVSSLNNQATIKDQEQSKGWTTVSKKKNPP